MYAWERAAKKVKTHAEFELSQRGKNAGNLTLELGNINRDRESYHEFLEKFVAMNEIMETDDTSFDYIFYTYSLELFGNMPLIEPLEYKDAKRINTMVIAIDTSGSVNLKKVQKFMEITYAVLNNSGHFSENCEIRIIQCDASIQDEKIIKNKEDMKNFINDLTLHGFGGTDFRPVFDYIEAMEESGECRKIDGLLYFTDGEGVFPLKVPKYPTAFIIDNPKYSSISVPAWAMKHNITGCE